MGTYGPSVESVPSKSQAALPSLGGLVELTDTPLKSLPMAGYLMPLKPKTI